MDLLFKDRADAGKRLANSLTQYARSDALVLGIPRGGAPVAAAAADRLELEWNVLPVRKLPIPWNPEAGFGALTLDGALVLNKAIIRGLRITQEQMNEVTNRVTRELARTVEALYRVRPTPAIAGRNVIVIDDGLASGYTMLAAINSVRARDAGRVVAAAPVTSKSAADLVGKAADECVFEIVSPSIPFAVANYYLHWRDLTDEEVIACFNREPPESR